jgi:hypothetical protein
VCASTTAAIARHWNLVLSGSELHCPRFFSLRVKHEGFIGNADSAWLFFLFGAWICAISRSSRHYSQCHMSFAIRSNLST